MSYADVLADVENSIEATLDKLALKESSNNEVFEQCVIIFLYKIGRSMQQTFVKESPFLFLCHDVNKSQLSLIDVKCERMSFIMHCASSINSSSISTSKKFCLSQCLY